MSNRPFVKIEIDTLDAMLDAGASGAAVKAFLALRRVIGESPGGACWRADAEVAKLARLGLTAYRAARRWLAERGFIAVEADDRDVRRRRVTLGDRIGNRRDLPTGSRHFPTPIASESDTDRVGKRRGAQLDNEIPKSDPQSGSDPSIRNGDGKAPDIAPSRPFQMPLVLPPAAREIERAEAEAFDRFTRGRYGRYVG